MNVTVSRNGAHSWGGLGGGIYCGNHSNPSMRNVIVSENTATSNGGGIHCDNSSPTLLNVIVSGNSIGTGYGGGISCWNNSNPSLVNVTVSGNSVRGWGGGIYCVNSSPSFDPVNRSNIYHNHAETGQDMYAFFSYQGVTMHVVVDTFTVMNPTEDHAYPLDHFTFDILHAKGPMGIDGNETLPTEFALHPAYPNPFNPSTTLRFDLPEAAQVYLVVYDLLGREVAAWRTAAW